MSAFAQAQEVEKVARVELVPWLRLGCAYVGMTDRKQFIQKIWGDFVVRFKDDKRYGKYANAVASIELKAEWEDKWGNLFLEWFSNKKWGTPGWMLTSHAQFLLYFFCNTGNAYWMDFQRLKDWAFQVERHRLRISRYDLKQQDKYEQLNDTWAYCVPIKHIEQAGLATIITREGRQDGAPLIPPMPELPVSLKTLFDSQESLSQS